jgi:hypothetical protein
VGGYKGKYELHHWFTPQSGGGSNAAWNYITTSAWLNRRMGDGGKLYNAFKASVFTMYASPVPTALINEATNKCGCEK